MDIIRKAYKFATLTMNGNIANVVEAPTDEHTLLPNQIPLTDEEYKFLRYNDLPVVKVLIKTIEKKIKEALQ